MAVASGGSHPIRPKPTHHARGRNAGMTVLSPKQEELCHQTQWDISDLRALFLNCTLKRSPEQSHTQGLADLSMEIMRRHGVTVGSVRTIDHDIATGVCPLYQADEGAWPHAQSAGGIPAHGNQRSEWTWAAASISPTLNTADVRRICL